MAAFVGSGLAGWRDRPLRCEATQVLRGQCRTTPACQRCPHERSQAVCCSPSWGPWRPLPPKFLEWSLHHSCHLWPPRTRARALCDSHLGWRRCDCPLEVGHADHPYCRPRLCACTVLRGPPGDIANDSFARRCLLLCFLSCARGSDSALNTREDSGPLRVVPVDGPKKADLHARHDGQASWRAGSLFELG